MKVWIPHEDGRALMGELPPPVDLEVMPLPDRLPSDPGDVEFLQRQPSVEVFTRTDGVILVLFSTKWRLEGFQRDNPSVRLQSLVAAGDD